MPPKNAETLTLLTARTFAVFIVADREEWETRDILSVLVVVVVEQSFSITRKSEVSAKCDASRGTIRIGWSRMGHLPRWMDRSRKRHYREMDDRCLTVATTWEKFQSGSWNIARINVAYTIPSRCSDISIALGYLVHRAIFPWLISLLPHRAVRIAVFSIANYKLSAR